MLGNQAVNNCSLAVCLSRSAVRMSFLPSEVKTDIRIIRSQHLLKMCRLSSGCVPFSQSSYQCASRWCSSNDYSGIDEIGHKAKTTNKENKSADVCCSLYTLL